MTHDPGASRSGIHPAVVDADAVLFDFDFTLADSSAGIITCMNYALTEMGLGESSNEDIINTIGLYIPEALVVLRGEQYRPMGQEFMKLFTHKADEVMVEGTYFLPGAIDVLKTLHGLGYRLGIVSTKFRFRIETTLERDGVLDTVEVIIGGEDVTHHKPHPESLLKATDRLGLPIERCVYLGDNEVDASAAKSAGIPFVPVRTGATPLETFDAYPRLALLESVADLVRD